jgi:hypothetical protein
VLAQKNPEGLHAKLIKEIADVCEPDHKTASCTVSVGLPHALLVRWTANVRGPISPLRVVRMITILITAAARAAIAASLPKGAKATPAGVVEASVSRSI